MFPPFRQIVRALHMTVQNAANGRTLRGKFGVTTANGALQLVSVVHEHEL